jgi:phosphatidate phosphatase PAH1
MMRLSITLVLLVACGGPLSTSSSPDAATYPPDTPIIDTGRFQSCVDHPFESPPEEDWRHTTSSLISVASPNHSAGDVFAHPHTTPYVGAKLAYGPTSKDLEDEDVLAFVDTCNGWRSLGRGKTDDDGRVRVKLPPLPTGVYEVRFQVAGDRSMTSAFAYVLPPGTRIAVTDIDATLTTSDAAVFQQIFDGSHVPSAYPDANRLIAAHATRGHVVMYLTGRPYWLAEPSRAWLALLQFPRGPLRVADSNTDIMPTEASVGEYKLARLKALVDAGYILDVAYGNASTDIYAYLGAGIAADQVWIIGSHGGEQGTHSVQNTWAPIADQVSAGSPVIQPFTR